MFLFQGFFFSIKPVSQSCAVAKSEKSWRQLDNQTWPIEWKTAPLAKAQLSEYENQTLEVFAVHDCETAFITLSLPLVLCLN